MLSDISAVLLSLVDADDVADVSAVRLLVVYDAVVYVAVLVVV